MAIIIPELVLEASFRDGLALLRKYPEKLNDLLAMYKEEWMAKQYGQKTINTLKTWIKDNGITMLLGWSDIPNNIPCVTITTLSSTELESEAYLGDYGFTETTETEPEIVLESIIPVSLDTTTGWMEFDPSSTNFGTVTNLYMYRDVAGASFSIKSIIDTDTRRALNMGVGVEADITGVGDIISSVDYYRDRYMEVQLQHQIVVSIHTEDPFLTKNLTYIMLYMLLSEKHRLVERGLRLSTFGTTEFTRDIQKLPEHIYTQSINVYGRTMFNWLDARDNLASTTNYKVRVPKDIYEREDGDIFTVDTINDDE